MTRSVEVTIRNEVTEIAVVRDALDQLGGEFEIAPQALLHLQVALDEIVSNVIKYSWIDDEQHEVLVRIAVHATGVSIDIFDDGQPFDPIRAPRQNQRLPGQRPRPGGVGIQMVKQLVDDFSYERVGGRNHTSLIKNCAVGEYSERENE